MRAVMPTRSALPLLLLAALPQALLAHAGHHHDTGLPDFAAHLFLGLQYLAVLLVPAAVLVVFLRIKKTSKSATPKKPK
jgi:hypothetical protein